MQKLRGAIVIVGSMALILQPPAQCWSCSLGLPNRVQSSAHQQQPGQPTLHGCCQNSATARPASVAAGNCEAHIKSNTCGCKFQASQRTYVAAERLIVPPDSMAILPSAQPFVAADTRNAEWLAGSSSDLPPPVPHRILHCSWII
jgi:hypothetical protein